MQNLTGIKYFSKSLLQTTINFFIPLALFGIFAFTNDDQPQWQPLFNLPTPVIEKISSDPYGFLYFSDDKGNVNKLDSLGRFVSVYSPRKNSPVDLLEGYRNVNIFLFYRNFQEYKILNRFLTEVSSGTFKTDNFGFIRLASLSADNNLWLIDDRDFSLKKLNLTFNRIEQKFSLEQTLPPGDYDFTFMREYNGNLFIADRNSGILVFDNLGTYKTKIPASHTTHFSFIGNTLYFINKEKLVLVNIQTGTSRIVDIPDNLKVKNIILHENRAYLVLVTGIRAFRHNIPL